MIERRPVALLVACGLFWAVLGGCASQSPEMGEAESALKEGDYDAALASVDRALERDSANADAYFFRADVLRQRADSTMEPDQYIALYRRATDAEAEAIAVENGLRPEVERRRARVYEREIGRAEAAYNRASKHDEEQGGRRSIAFFGAAGATQPDSARPVLNEAFARMKVGQTDEAVPVLERYVERADTVRETAYKVLGKLYVSAQQYENATDLLDRAMRAYPADETLQALRLNAYNQTGDVDEALSAYREQIERTPDRAAYRYNYGALLLRADRYGEAIDQLRRAAELRPDNAEGQYNLGAAYLNAALARDDSLTAAGAALDGSLGRPAERRQLFENAIPPLERARALIKAQYADVDRENTLREDACRALLVAYVQTDRPNRAAQVQDCTGFTRSRR